MGIAISAVITALVFSGACLSQQGQCVAAIWWDIRAINELKDKDFSTRCPDCGHQDVFFGVEAIEICHGELSPIERMELDEEELREFGVDETAESEE